MPNGPTWFQTVRVRFEGADEDAANPGSPDPDTATGFVTDPTPLNGKRFVRFEIAFDLAAPGGAQAGPEAPRPLVRRLRLPFRF